MSKGRYPCSVDLKKTGFDFDTDFDSEKMKLKQMNETKSEF